MDYQLFNEDLMKEMRADPEGLGDWLILQPSDDYPGYWEIEAVYDDYLSQFEDLVGNYRVISPARLDIFMERVDKGDFKVAFTEDPTAMIELVKSWNSTPPVELQSELENTINGFLPWQVVGFNKLVKSDLTAGYAVWDTGTGKTALIASSILWHQQQNAFDLALVFVKAHNKTDMQRKLKRLGGINAHVIDDSPMKRASHYWWILKMLDQGRGPLVVITNYEKIRDDAVYDQLVKKRRVLCYWDEMPTKLAHRKTKLYKATKEMLYKSFVSKPNPKWMRHLVLSATPLDKDPDDVYGCVNLVRPYYLGTPSDFYGRYVRRRNWISGEPELWGDLDEIEIRMDHMVHRVSEDDPEVAAMLPTNIIDERVLDWNYKHRYVYDKLTKKAREIYDEEEKPNALALIQVMQMLCDAPSMVLASAENRTRFEAMLQQYGNTDSLPPVSGPTGSSIALRLLEHVHPSELTDVGHAKLEWFREILTEKHPDDKVVVHSTWADYIFPVWEEWLDKWGVSYVMYRGTDKHRQQALDQFRSDWDIQVFLSGDSGSDSIDIPQARAGVQYNLPWGFVTDTQRKGRYRRVDSLHAHVHTHYGRMVNSVEDRKKQIQDRKRSYHAQIFEGRAVESALSVRLTDDDFRFMLFGDAI